MGLFDRFRKNPNTERNDTITEEMSHQDILIQQVNDARAKYKEDGDLDSALQVYRNALVVSDPPLFNSNAHAKFFVDLLLKANRNDEAWGFLNGAILDMPKYGKCRMTRDKIFEEMGNILKKEKRYSYAIEMYLLSFYELFNGWQFNEDKIRKTISPLVKKAGYTEADETAFVEMVKHQIELQDINGSSALRKTYRDYIKNEKI